MWWTSPDRCLMVFWRSRRARSLVSALAHRASVDESSPAWSRLSTEKIACFVSSSTCCEAGHNCLPLLLDIAT